MLLVWVFIGLVWTGYSTSTGTQLTGPPVFYSEAVSTHKKCQDLLKSFQKSEEIINQGKTVTLKGQCIQEVETWGDKDPIKDGE